MASDDIRLQRFQFQLLLSYINLEETVRRWHPEMQWTEDQVTAFITERDNVMIRRQSLCVFCGVLAKTPGRKETIDSLLNNRELANETVQCQPLYRSNAETAKFALDKVLRTRPARIF